MQKPVERLGSFFLGAEYDLKSQQRTETPVNYDARDLTTHAVCVGMTGSGKTGLCIGLLEEAALDSVPAILIDPKGDITNLLLQFPELRPADFRPWINADDARRKGQSEDEFAQATADLWRNGLADWGITGERIRQMGESAEFTIYTPGSTAGVPISILTSLAAPQLDFAQHTEAIREQISGTVSALLGLVDLNVDPVRSPEAILLSTILEHFWRQNQDVDLTTLITAIQKPPVAQVGVLDLEFFFPKKDRFQLAMAFNNLIAAPSFQSWLEGEALDIDRILYTEDGKPRHSVFYIAHLSDNERMFFVTLLLESVLGWVRRQAGTSSLRALLYFDEVFGFFPPVAEPPSKRPLLALLKQARAFGLGVILVTQNPADLDYKGLTNAGTWFIGKLQAERDKQRLLEGLQTAASIDSPDYKDLISQLSSRVFLLHNVHETKPVVMHTRWAMSYLRGPLTRPQIEKLVPEDRRTQTQRQAATDKEPQRPLAQAAETRHPAASTPPAQGLLPTPPSLDPAIPQVFIPVEIRLAEAIDIANSRSVIGVNQWAGHLLYQPAIVANAEVSFVDTKLRVDEKTQQTFVAEFPEQAWSVDWGRAETVTLGAGKLESKPISLSEDEGPFFASLTELIDQAKLKRLNKELSDWLYANSRLSLITHPDLDITQLPDESEREFKLRLRQGARERRDQDVDMLEKKYGSQLDKIEARHKRIEDDYIEDKAELDSRQQQELLNVGESVVGMFLGRRSRKSVSSYASKRRMTRKARVSMESTEREIADLEEEMRKLEEALAQETDEITRRWADSLDEGLTTTEVKPRRADVDVNLVAVGWVPVWMVRPGGEPAERAEFVPAYKTPAEAN